MRGPVPAPQWAGIRIRALWRHPDDVCGRPLPASACGNLRGRKPFSPGFTRLPISLSSHAFTNLLTWNFSSWRRSTVSTIKASSELLNAIRNNSIDDDGLGLLNHTVPCRNTIHPAVDYYIYGLPPPMPWRRTSIARELAKLKGKLAYV